MVVARAERSDARRSRRRELVDNFDAYRPRLTNDVDPPNLRTLQRRLAGVRAPVPCLRVHVLTDQNFGIIGHSG